MGRFVFGYCMIVERNTYRSWCSVGAGIVGREEVVVGRWFVVGGRIVGGRGKWWRLAVSARAFKGLVSGVGVAVVLPVLCWGG